jgi:serralysin
MYSNRAMDQARFSTPTSCEAVSHAAAGLQIPQQGPQTIDLTGPIQDIEWKTPPFWPNGSTLRIGFLGGNDWQRIQVATHAVEWTKWANLSFDFVAIPPIDILIDFVPPSSWSRIGTESRDVASYMLASMNLGWIEPQIPPRALRAVILHEFGHALELTHEHQSCDKRPEDNLAWNRQAVYQYFGGKPNEWDVAKINWNILANNTGHVLKRSFFDIDSIMLYSFPKDLFLGGSGTNENFELSQGSNAVKISWPKPR